MHEVDGESMLDSFMNAAVEQIGQSGAPSVSALMLLVAAFLMRKVPALVSKCPDGPLVDALLKGRAVLSKDLCASCPHPNSPVVLEGSDEYARCRACVLGDCRSTIDMFIILSRAKAVPARVPMGRNSLLISDPGRRAATVSRIMAEILA